MSSTGRYTAYRTSLRTAGIMLVFTVVFTALMSGAYSLTKPNIEAARLAAKMKLIDEILPANRYDNDLLADYIDLGPTPELGLGEGGRVYRARINGNPAALVLDVIAPDGYGGQIALAVAVNADDTLAAVRATEHKETPGLGDYIDPRKDRNKSEPWITQFNGKNLTTVGESGWKLKRDGGIFDYRTGATISARAVTAATARALRYASINRAAIFDAKAGQRLSTGLPQ